MLRVYSVFDVKSEAYGTPFFCPTKGLAIRSFTEAVNDSQTSISRYPHLRLLFLLYWDLVPKPFQAFHKWVYPPGCQLQRGRVGIFYLPYCM